MTDRTAAGLALSMTALMALAVGIATLMPLPVQGPPGGDKLHHVLAFAALVLPAAALRPRWALPLCLAAIAYGGAIELVQPAVGRAREMGDWLADALGAVLGAGGGALVAAALARRPARGG